MLYILRSFQSQWFLKKFVPREKSSRLREMHRLGWESFFAKPKTTCGWPKRRLAANWDSVCVPAAGRRSWSRQTWTASLIVPSVDEFRTSKRRELRDRRQPAIDCPSWLRSAQQSRYCRSDAFAQMGTARFIIAARKRADPNRDDADKTNVEATDHA